MAAPVITSVTPRAMFFGQVFTVTGSGLTGAGFQMNDLTNGGFYNVFRAGTWTDSGGQLFVGGNAVADVVIAAQLEIFNTDGDTTFDGITLVPVPTLTGTVSPTSVGVGQPVRFDLTIDPKGYNYGDASGINGLRWFFNDGAGNTWNNTFFGSSPTTISDVTSGWHYVAPGDYFPDATLNPSGDFDNAGPHWAHYHYDEVVVTDAPPQVAIESLTVTPTRGDLTTTYEAGFTITFASTDPRMQWVLDWQMPGQYTGPLNVAGNQGATSPFTLPLAPILQSQSSHPLVPGVYTVTLTVYRYVSGVGVDYTTPLVSQSVEVTVVGPLSATPGAANARFLPMVND